MRFYLRDQDVRARAVAAVHTAPPGWQVIVREPPRSLDQNAAMWPILDAFARQLQWPVNGKLVSLEPDDWKDILTAAFEQDARVAEGLNGGFVFLGQRTSQFTKAKFSAFLEFLHATAVERGVEI